MPFEPLPPKFSFPDAEREVIAFWEQHDVFQRSMDERRGAPRFVFYEGPPTANGVPHPGHCLTRAIKDLFPRYRTMTGHLVERKAGWDTHGLPVEVEVCKELGIHTKEEIERFGVEKFVRRCIESVFRYVREWEEMTRRLGFWVNLEEAYVTYHQSYVESVWWSLKTLFDHGLLYQGHKIVWWWAQGGTALSAGEVGEGYREVEDPAVYIRFPLLGGIGVPPVSARPLRAHPAVDDQLAQRRRLLPHWEAGGSTYFMTFRLHAGELSPEERTLVLEACRHFDADRYLLHAAVVMPDHVHLLWTPLERAAGEWWSIADLMHSMKSFTAKALNAARGTTGVIWQREYYDRIIRSASDFDEKWKYIVENPARRGLSEQYEWVWVESPADPAPRDVRPDRGNANHRRDADAPRGVGAREDRRDADAPRVSLLVWTTTPWTLVSNHFAAVGPDMDYALVHDHDSDEYLYVAEALVGAVAQAVKHRLEVVGACKGRDLVGQRYVPPFDCYYTRMREQSAELKEGGAAPIGWRVLAADFVTLDSGTGLVHEAPAFGEVDFKLLQEERQRFREFDAIPLINAVAPNGTFTDEAPEAYRGRWVKDCDKEIIRELKQRGVLYHQETIKHPYPFCPRAEDDPLIQYARKSWFVRTSQFRDEFLKNNDKINWLPEHIQEGRFGDFLRNNVDWALSRERYWGTPLPIWRCERCGKMEAVGSFAELTDQPGATDDGAWARAKAEDPTIPDHLRVHKPYVDAWTFDATCCEGARMRRVPEVIDCWWDAGSMPFAQWGFPHAADSVRTFTERFPADFISEAIDQTRGWFYGLLAISTLLFREGVPPEGDGPRAPRAYPHPYRTCIVLGHMAGEDGLKMSKRKKNYREPGYIFDHYGADAMRWYFFSAQTPWTSVRFLESAIRDTQREFLLRLYNVFSFFNIYANLDGFVAHPSQGSPWRPTAQRSELDRWIISELHRTIRFVREKLDAFENYPAAGRLNEFVDALSNWYVRRSRERFWKSEKDQDKWDAHHTLYGVLWTLSQLIAPFTPFFAEAMYRNLSGTKATEAGSAAAPPPRSPDVTSPPLSVHLCDYPSADESLIDEDLAAEMDLVRQIVSLGRAARTSAKLKVRQPLALAEVILARREHAEWLAGHRELIAEELNIKQVEYTTEAEQYVTYQIKPNFQTLGPQYGKLAPRIAAELGRLDPVAARQSLETGGELWLEVDGQRLRLGAQEVQIQLEARPGWSAAQGRGGVVVVKTELTRELIDEGLLREFIHHVQGLRRELDLPFDARIVLYVQAPEDLADIVRRYGQVVQRECLAERIEFTPAPAGASRPAQIEGRSVALTIERC